MDISGVLTKRNHIADPSWDLIFEWEDIFNKALKCDLIIYPKFADNRIIRRIPIITNLLLPSECMVLFEMNTKRWFGNVNNKKNIIPIIVDFYLKECDLKKFYSSYSNNPVIFVTSREVYDFLHINNCPLHIEHLPLSISDKYCLSSNSIFANRKYDLVMIGRQNKILSAFIERYSKCHPEFYYVYRTIKNGKFCYITSKGEEIGDISSRKDYFNLLKQSKVGLYSTPGIDGGESRTNGFNQVTPRFLELIASGCHVIARYPSNSDTFFYELDKFSPHVDTYEDFCRLLNKKLVVEPDYRMYSDYLSHHYTSVRAYEIKKILERI